MCVAALRATLETAGALDARINLCSALQNLSDKAAPASSTLITRRPEHPRHSRIWLAERARITRDPQRAHASRKTHRSPSLTRIVLPAIGACHPHTSRPRSPASSFPLLAATRARAGAHPTHPHRARPAARSRSLLPVSRSPPLARRHLRAQRANPSPIPPPPSGFARRPPHATHSARAHRASPTASTCARNTLIYRPSYPAVVFCTPPVARDPQLAHALRKTHRSPSGTRGPPHTHRATHHRRLPPARFPPSLAKLATLYADRHILPGHTPPPNPPARTLRFRLPFTATAVCRTGMPPPVLRRGQAQPVHSRDLNAAPPLHRARGVRLLAAAKAPPVHVVLRSGSDHI
ncbi:hypothetical protein GGX14DRAFT_644867 [Mycena pura]|uniref:Uncharacterized protein n=1 Tax=Mycena pura TaxID=153505 RepID=A0AAD6VC66_9AGAR|nr:hypothetical protein GGX14DRAFT_644867 [Mycena pura]